MLRLRSTLTLVVALGSSGCGGGGVEAPAPRRPSSPVASAAPSAAPKAPAMASFEVTRVPEGTFGPYIGRRKAGAVVLWAAPEGQQRAWFARGIDDHAEPTAAAFRVAEAPADVGLVAVRAFGGAAPDDGFLVLSTSREFSGERVDALVTGSEGKLVGGPTPLAQSLPNVVWVDAVPIEGGALALWAVKRSGQASLYVAVVGPSGEPRSAAVEVVDDARAWQVAPVAGGVALCVVRAGSGDAAGTVVVSFVDDAGAPEGREVLVSSSPTADPDIDMIQVKDHLVVAWTDRRFVDARLVAAVLGPDGTLARQPEPLTTPRGPQALLRLVPPVSPGAPAFVAWEDQLERPARGRRIHVGRIDESGTLSAETATVEHAAEDGSVPEFEGTPDGLGILTLAAACQRGAPCDRDRIVPTFARLGLRMDAEVSEPVRLDALAGAVAELTWGLTCRGSECMALAALPTVPAPVYSVRLGGLGGGWLSAVHRDGPGPLPRVESIEVVGQADSLASIATARVGDGDVAAWLSYFDPAIPYERPKKAAPDGRMAPVRAVLRVGRVGDAEPTVLSYRARSVGGLGLAANDAASRVLVVWSALESGEPQVFVTLLDDKGRKVKQRMLTRSKGSISDVAVVRVAAGWVVAWIDGRHGGADVYAARLDEALVRVGPEQRLTDSAGNTSAVSLLAQGDHVFVAWADARGHEAGVGDLFVGRLSAKDAALVGPGTRLTRTADNSHSPVLARQGTGAMLAWLEESVGSRESEALVMFQRLDSGAEPASPAESLVLAGRPLAASLECDAAVCRVALIRTDRGAAELLGFTYASRRDVEPMRLVALETASHDAVAPVVLGSSVYYGDLGTDGVARVRRVKALWQEPAAAPESGPAPR